MRRRALLRFFAAAAAWARTPIAALAQSASLSASDEGRLRALADVVLPNELTAVARGEVVDEFLRWIRNYREGAEMDHGYGFTRLRRTPASPASRYPAQLAALDRAARGSGASFESLDAPARRAVVEAAIDAARIERLPVRPTGDHVATDLMAFYFNSAAAADLAYRAAIGRDTCRGLEGSDEVPTRLGRGSDPDRIRVGPGSDPVRIRVGQGSDWGQSTSTARLKLPGRPT